MKVSTDLDFYPTPWQRLGMLTLDLSHYKNEYFSQRGTISVFFFFLIRLYFVLLPLIWLVESRCYKASCSQIKDRTGCLWLVFQMFTLIAAHCPFLLCLLGSWWEQCLLSLCCNPGWVWEAHSCVNLISVITWTLCFLETQFMTW